MSNSQLTNYVKLSPNYSSRNGSKITTITIHHMAGDLSVEVCGNVFQNREASANYGIGSDGRVGLYVEECNRAWTSSSYDNDRKAITIEVANDSGAPNWHVSNKAMAKLIDLCVDICQRNGIKKLNYTGDKTGNLTMHKMFASTVCPRPIFGKQVSLYC
jgi:N-acetyl-anhydromuramyl-L-alanine amidase AmpD